MKKNSFKQLSGELETVQVSDVYWGPITWWEGFPEFSVDTQKFLAARGLRHGYFVHYRGNQNTVFVCVADRERSTTEVLLIQRLFRDKDHTFYEVLDI